MLRLLNYRTERNIDAISHVVPFLYIGLLQITSLPVSFWSAPAFDLATVFAPWLILQPVLRKGRYAAKTPIPRLTRFLNLALHAIFDVGLYLIWFVLA